jgi:hypothetical protein
VTVTGAGFTSATAVTFGGTAAASFTVISDSSITAVTPAHAAGNALVEVTTSAGTSTLGSGYNFSDATPTVSLASSSANPAQGASVTFTATLSGGASPSGTVIFQDDGKTIGSATISGKIATFETSSLAGGSQTITAQYEGDGSNGAAESPMR